MEIEINICHVICVIKNGKMHISVWIKVKDKLFGLKEENETRK